ncbi:MAG: prepilin-type N-terminal cleavage/methylation domain-containing protein [Magnetococcales bacterium]|nr:prepilin-type N-terminal cleavage/methylation domain-containing protein [Magnetococcales bacterium]
MKNRAASASPLDPRRPRRAAGFTMVEMILSIMLLGMIAALGSNLLSAGFQAYFALRDLSPLSSAGQYAMERMVRELRAASSCAGVTPANGTAGGNLSFTDANATVITFNQSGGNDTAALWRNGVLLSDDVEAGTFNVSRSSCLVTISFTMQKLQDGTPTARLPLRTAVYVRNE